MVLKNSKQEQKNLQIFPKMKGKNRLIFEERHMIIKINTYFLKRQLKDKFEKWNVFETRKLPPSEFLLVS